VDIWLSVCAVLALAMTVLSTAMLVRAAPTWLISDPNTKSKHVTTLDGLRGIVALAVVMHHSIWGYLKHATNVDGVPVDNFQSQLGSASVSIFFMISAYLFCGPLIKKRGTLDVLKLAESRVIRIVPLYALVVCMTVLFALWITDFELAVSSATLLVSIARISMFNFVDMYQINNVDVWAFVGPFWTLRYEWMLYASLPLLALAIRRTGKIWPLFAGLIGYGLFDPLFFFFVTGAAASVLVKYDDPKWQTAWRIGGMIGLLIVLFGFHDSRNWPQAVLLTPFFVAVLQGHRSYAILAWRPLRFLGEISFSVYLLHGFVIWFVTHILVGTENFPDLGVAGAFLVFWLTGALAVGLAIAGHLAVERPLMGWRPLSDYAARSAERRQFLRA
jgi:peptidoglycan/LPS O-acetylase OafA/YrhL